MMLCAHSSYFVLCMFFLKPLNTFKGSIFFLVLNMCCHVYFHFSLTSIIQSQYLTNWELTLHFAKRSSKFSDHYTKSDFPTTANNDKILKSSNEAVAKVTSRRLYAHPGLYLFCCGSLSSKAIFMPLCISCTVSWFHQMTSLSNSIVVHLPH